MPEGRADGSPPANINEAEAAAILRERYLSSWLALAGEKMEVQLFDNP